MRVHGEPLAAPERAGQVRATHTAWCCVLPCSERSRATSACLRNVPSPVRLQRPIPRRRWIVGTDGTHCSPQVMGSFDTILVVLGMLLQHASSTKQVLLASGHTVEGAQAAWQKPPCARAVWKAAGEHQSTTTASWKAAHRPQVLRARRSQHVASADCITTTADRR